VEVYGNTAAFLMIERSDFVKFYFNENYQECFEDVELNLQMLKLGRKNYQVGHAVAYHYESQTRNEVADKNKMVIEDYQSNLLPFFKKNCVPLFFAQLFEGASRAAKIGDYQTAVEIGELLLEQAPRNPDIQHLLGWVLSRGGDQVRAIRHIRQAIMLNGRVPSYHFNLAEALLQQGNLALAEQSYRQVLQLAPTRVTCVKLANLLKDQGRLDEALSCYQQALRLEPDNAIVYCDIGDVMRRQGAYQAAMECFQRALHLQPDLALAHHYLGVVLYEANRLGEAAQAFRQALHYQPHWTETWSNLGAVLEQQGLIDDARSCCQRVFAGGAEDTLFQLRADSLCSPVLASSAAIEAYRIALLARLKEWRQPPDLTLDLQSLHTSRFEPPVQLAYQGRDDRPLKEAWAALFQKLLPEFETPPPVGGRTHIGFVVTRGHEGVFLKGMGGMLNQLSAQRFDMTLACSRQGGEALLQAGIRNPAIRYLPLPERFDQCVEQLRQARFSLLYYWEVGTDSTNYFLPFFRLAPVQCTGWGWPVTSGIPQMDYFLSSQHQEASASEAHYSERLVQLRRLPAYIHRPGQLSGAMDREHLGLSPGQHLYLCPQNLRKVHPDFDPLLAGLLRCDPLGVAVLVDAGQSAVTAALHQRLQAGMPDVIDRVRFLPQLAYQDYLRLLAAADVALDTLHFGGGITTYEALAVGLPIVTLPGAFNRGRYVHAAYQQAGLDEGIAADPEDYIKRAVRFASETDYRAAFGRRLHEASAELFEDRVAVREFEDFLEAAAVAGE